jgi:hypothetical protein
MAIFMGYLLYKTNAIASFLSEYMSSVATRITSDVTNSLFNPLLFFSIFLIIIATLIILVLMKIKDKPVKFYLYNIATYVFLIIYYYIAFNIIKSLETGLVDVKTLKLLQDVATLALMIQVVGFVFVIIRATGFDIKSFNFKKDLEELNIESSDNEEFEVDMEVDTNKLKRKFNKSIRHVKYIYFENKLLINILITIIILAIALIFYLNNSVYHKTYQLNQTLKTNQFIFNIQNAYHTENDYAGKQLKEYYQIVVIKLQVKSLNIDRQLQTGRFYLDIDGYKYYHTDNYKDRLIDFGITYQSQTITSDFSNYLLVFEVPSSRINKKMTLYYTDTDNSKIKMSITSTDLTNKQTIGTYTIGQNIDFKQSILADTSLQINSIEIDQSFKLNYNYCIEDNCIESSEYIRPSTKNGATYLIKINNQYSSSNTKINTFYKFISYFGKIKYTIDGVEKVMNIPITEVNPKKAIKDATYIEITNDVVNAEEIILEFNIQNKIYQYKLR